jgi:hypothetical protein
VAVRGVNCIIEGKDVPALARVPEARWFLRSSRMFRNTLHPLSARSDVLREARGLCTKAHALAEAARAPTTAHSLPSMMLLAPRTSASATRTAT